MDVQIEVAEAMRSLLDKGERLLWSGRPRQGIVIRWADGPQMAFFVVWLIGIAVLINTDETGFVLLFLGPGIVFALIALFGRFIVDAYQRKKTLYGVTNQRVIIWSGVLTKSVRSVSLSSIFDMRVEERGNGCGTITFGVSRNSRSLTEWWEALTSQDIDKKPAFFLDGDVQHVAEIVRRAQAAMQTSSTT